MDLVAPKVIWDDTSAVYDNCAGCMVNKAAYTKYMLYESELLGQLKLYLDDTYKTVM